MGLEYFNRRKKRYFVHQGTTKTGKPKYYASTKDGATRIDRMPDGYEFYEEPQSAIVTIRKMKPTRILPLERTRLEAWTRGLAGIEHFIVEIDGDSLIVHTPGNGCNDPPGSRIDEVYGKFGIDTTMLRSIFAESASYSPMFRFTLIDEDRRIFSADRWCYRGGIDTWISLMGRNESLETLAREYLPHLAKESFFELIW
jgi:hypothetical protein